MPCDRYFFLAGLDRIFDRRFEKTHVENCEDFNQSGYGDGFREKRYKLPEVL